LAPEEADPPKSDLGWVPSVADFVPPKGLPVACVANGLVVAAGLGGANENVIGLVPNKLFVSAGFESVVWVSVLAGDGAAGVVVDDVPNNGFCAELFKPKLNEVLADENVVGLNVGAEVDFSLPSFPVPHERQASSSGLFRT
jgi:hypothetical protein